MLWIYLSLGSIRIAGWNQEFGQYSKPTQIMDGMDGGFWKRICRNPPLKWPPSTAHLRLSVCTCAADSTEFEWPPKLKKYFQQVSLNYPEIHPIWILPALLEGLMTCGEHLQASGWNHQGFETIQPLGNALPISGSKLSWADVRPYMCIHICIPIH